MFTLQNTDATQRTMKPFKSINAASELSPATFYQERTLFYSAGYGLSTYLPSLREIRNVGEKIPFLICITTCKAISDYRATTFSQTAAAALR